ncbi:MAG TPA: SprT family zinc-dependent metalloprotease [Parvularculaceae bacterium]|nr:SprT family zinc-dependent metalloprotease [Parvularculaceae bacterium]
MTTRTAPQPLLTTIDLGDRTAPLTARVNRRARRLIITVDSVAGRVIVTAPSKRAIPEAIDFARTRSSWIKSQLSEALGARPFISGSAFPLRGRSTEIVQSGATRSAVRLDGERLFVGGDEVHINRRVTDWLKRQARAAVTERVDFYAGALNRKRGAISIRDTRSRWGSCAADGSLSFSWRLILAPPAILDYVAAHECAHLVYLNHSPAFWRLLRELGVDAGGARDWFSANGSDLYAYGALAA